MLLLLDNFEHLIQAAPTVAELLAMAPHLKILVTSRAALHVYGEHEFPVPPLALPDARSMPSLEVLSQYPAVALFVQRAVAAKPDFELNAENARAVTEICARLDGLPLAIELAAARVKVLSPSSMRTRLASRLQLLTGGARDLPQRQQTLRATMDWSYDLLSAAEQKLFRRLSVFVGGCNLEGVEAVCDTKGDLDLDLLDGMASMVDKSLLQQVEQANGESRFVMLETIREYALEKLEASGEQASTKRAHAAYCLVLAEEEATEQSGAEGTEWLERFALEHDNFRAALEWLTETGDAEWGLRLGAALFRFLGGARVSRRRPGQAGQAAEAPGSGSPPRRERARFLPRACWRASKWITPRRMRSSGRAWTSRVSWTTSRASPSRSTRWGSMRGTGATSQLRTLCSKKALCCGENWATRRPWLVPSATWPVSSNCRAIMRRRALPARRVSLHLPGTGRSHRRRLVAELSGGCRARSGRFRGRAGVVRTGPGDFSGTRGPLGHRRHARPIWETWRGNSGIAATAHSLYRESLKIFQDLEHKRGIARLLECFACFSGRSTGSGTFAAAGRRGGRAAAEHRRSAHACGTGQTGSHSGSGAAGIKQHRRRDRLVGRLGYAGGKSD